MGVAESLVDRKTLRAPYPASQAVAVGDLLFWDNVNKLAKPASLRTDLGSLAANQEDFAPIFFGVSAEQRLSTETATTLSTAPTGPGDRAAVAEGVFDCPCTSQTWEFGDLVGIDRNSGTPVNYTQQVNKVTQPNGTALAIGYCVKREPTAVTKVRVFLSAYQFGWFRSQAELPPWAFPRNMVDGGDFTINPWQRGTSFAAIANTLTYTADRWFVVGGASSSIAVSQLADATVPGFTTDLKWQRTAANTNTAAIYLGQVLETADCVRAQGQLVTLSFWAKAGANYSGGNLTVQVNHSTTAGNDTAAHLVAASTNWQATPTVVNATQLLTTTMTRYSFTGYVPLTATQLGVLFSWTPTGTAGTDDSISINGVQLEVAPTATAFEHRDVEMELALCQRYFYQINEPASGVVVGPGMITAAAVQSYILPMPTQMRAAPTVTVSVGTFKVNLAGTATTPTAFAAGSTHTQNYITVTSANTGQTAGQASLLQGGGGSGYIQASADL